MFQRCLLIPCCPSRVPCTTPARVEPFPSSPPAFASRKRQRTTACMYAHWHARFTLHICTVDTPHHGLPLCARTRIPRTLGTHSRQALPSRSCQAGKAPRTRTHAPPIQRVASRHGSSKGVDLSPHPFHSQGSRISTRCLHVGDHASTTTA